MIKNLIYRNFSKKNVYLKSLFIRTQDGIYNEINNQQVKRALRVQR